MLFPKTRLDKAKDVFLAIILLFRGIVLLLALSIHVRNVSIGDHYDHYGCAGPPDQVAEMTIWHGLSMRDALRYEFMSERDYDDIHIFDLQVCSWTPWSAEVWVRYDLVKEGGLFAGGYLDGSATHVYGEDGWITFGRQNERWVIIQADYESDGIGTSYGTFR